MIKNATGKWPVFIGKPEPTMVDIVREKYGYDASSTVVVGDRLYTDIATGLNAHVAAVCVLTGEATVDEIQNGEVKPTYTFNSVKDIFDILVASINPEYELKLSLSARSKKITDDVLRCEEVLASGNEQFARALSASLYQEYELKHGDGSSLEQLREIKRQLMWAIRML